MNREKEKDESYLIIQASRCIFLTKWENSIASRTRAVETSNDNAVNAICKERRVALHLSTCYVLWLIE